MNKSMRLGRKAVGCLPLSPLPAEVMVVMVVLVVHWHKKKNLTSHYCFAFCCFSCHLDLIEVTVPLKPFKPASNHVKGLSLT